MTAYAGPSTITTNNTTIDSKTINTCLEIRATGVIIKNSQINCDPNTSSYAVLVDDSVGAFDVTLTDDDIVCTANVGNSTALGSAFITALRVDISGCENGGDINQSFDIQDSYIHDMFQSADTVLYPPDGTHTDGLQFGTGHFTPPGGALVGNVINVTIKHNTIMSMCPGATTPEPDADCYTTSAIIDHSFAANTNITISQNLMAGGAATLYCSIGFTGTNYHVDDNRFSTRYNTNVGFFQPVSECGDQTNSGNIYYESGLPVDMNQ